MIRRMPGSATWIAIASLALTWSSIARAAVVPGRIVVREGDQPEGDGAVTSLGPTFVNALGEVAFVGQLSDGDHMVFIGNAAVWLGSDEAGAVLSAAETATDSNGLGRWVYPPDVDGMDGLYTDAGVLAVEGQQAADYPGGVVYLFHTLPTMTADGTIYWIAGIDDDDDGLVDGRAFYRSTDGTPATIEVVMRSGDALDGFVIDSDLASVANPYAVSENGQHRIHVIGTTADPTQDSFVRVDDVFMLREGDPTGDGDNWQTFDLVAINGNGAWLATGDTAGPTATDEFVAFNGAIVAREGDVVGGVTLGTPASLRHAVINDLDQAAHVWAFTGAGGSRESMFFVCDVADFAGSTETLFTTVDDSLDVDADGVGDYTITNVVFSSTTASRLLGETPYVYPTLVLDDGLGPRNAVVELPASCCGNGAVNPFEECDDGNPDDTDDCLASCELARCGDGFVWAGIEECDDGDADNTDDCPTTCVLPSCGDGFVYEGIEACDDGDADDGDACLSTCEPASCGDGFVYEGIEACDDGNTDDGDDCAADCTLPVSSTSSGGGETSGGETSSGGAETSTTMAADESTGSPMGGSTSGPTGDDTTTGTSSTTAGSDSSDGEAAADDDDAGCGCRSDGDTPPWWALMVALARRRRRRAT